MLFVTKRCDCTNRFDEYDAALFRFFIKLLVGQRNEKSLSEINDCSLESASFSNTIRILDFPFQEVRFGSSSHLVAFILKPAWSIHPEVGTGFREENVGSRSRGGKSKKIG